MSVYGSGSLDRRPKEHHRRIKSKCPGCLRRSQAPLGGEAKKSMPVVKVRDNEPFEIAMKRFKKQCEKAGILSELKRREYYDKPSIRKKKKTAAARKRALKKMRRMSR